MFYVFFFKAYFTDGINPVNEDLLNIAEGVGIHRDRATEVITSNARLEATKKRARQWVVAGVSGKCLSLLQSFLTKQKGTAED